MPILWDSPLVSAVAGELRDLLGTRAHDGVREQARLRAFQIDYETDRLLLWFREATLDFHLHPEEGALLVLDPVDPPETARRLAASLVQLETPPDDRLLLFHLRKVRGGRERYLVAVELMTNQWNAVVAEGDDLRIRHLLRERSSSTRPLEVGGVYRRPEPSTREGADGAVTPARLHEIAEGGRGALLSTVAWTSSLNVDALLEEPGDARYALWERIVEAARGSTHPVVLVGDEALQPYPLPLPTSGSRDTDTLLDAFRAAVGEADAPVAAIPPGWIRRLEKRAGRALGRIRGLTRELEGAEDPDRIRALGDLLLARFSDVRRGADRVRLTDFEGEEVEVELDPALSPQENAAAYYDRAAKAARARERLPDMIEDARAEADRLEALLERARAGDADPDEVRAEFPDRGSDSSDDEGPGLPYRRYRSSGGLEIRVGRGSKHNDDLTFHHSRPDDVWMHARQAPGAHVVLRWAEEGGPPAKDLAEAATLAALHSKARTSGSVPVAWTRRKYVRKPRKAPPGTVLPDRVQTVFVVPDPAVEERLREK